MKKHFLVLSFAFLLAFITAYPVSAYNDSRLVWITKPELEYEKIYYCGICNLFGDGVRGNINVGDIDYFGADLSDIGRYLREFKYADNSVYVSAGHGYNTSEYFYDGVKDIFVIYTYGESGGQIEYYTLNDLVETRLIPVRRIDSEKIEFDESDEWRQLDYASVGDAYAIMYGGKFITGFIYDGYESRGSRHTVNDLIDMKYKGKYGIIDRYGNTAVPFLFDDVEFIDDNTAFVKYNGKYGVLDVRNTVLNFSVSPATGNKATVYIAALSASGIFMLSQRKRFKQNL